MEEQIITLGTYTFERAQIVKTLLESDGIECFVQNVNLIQGAVSTGVKVRIRQSDLERSMALLESWTKLEREADKKLTDVDTTPRILLPVDFSNYSRKAADFAFDWAVNLGAELTLLHTYFDPVVNTLPFTDTYMYDVNLEELAVDMKETGEKGLKEMKQYLDEKNKPLGDKKIKIKSILSKGVAEDEIINYSNLYKPTLIIMGTRGKDRKSSELIGSVTAEVIDLAKVPVLAIPEDFPYKDIESIHNVLYITNFDDADFRALDTLERILKPIGVKIVCAHVGSGSVNEWDEVRMDGLREYMKKKYNETDVDCSLIQNEDFWVGIESFIPEKDISILCFTAKRRNIISRLLNPSVAKRMLFHSTTPLLVFHA
jgi:nucleotide-binding universal stress UspA family protein